MFGDVDYDPACAYSATVPLEEQLQALGDLQRQGKVRHVALSNETPYGLIKCLWAGQRRTTHDLVAGAVPGSRAHHGPPPSARRAHVPAADRAAAAGGVSALPRVAALQNALSLTCRTFDAGLAEVCHLEGVSLLAYSPLAMGWLTVSAARPGCSRARHASR